MSIKDRTHFGYQEVPVEEKAGLVRNVFNDVATKYDIMNDLMSFGLHRYWKFLTCELAGVRPGYQVLDLAGGTGDVARKLAHKVGPKGHVVVADINDNMLKVGRDRLIDQGLIQNLSYAQVNAEALPFPENTFHTITIAFGLRNVTRPELALNEMQRVLKPGGRCLVLEFSQPKTTVLKTAYDAYSFSVIPKVGRWVTGNAEPYQYLVESIRKHPNQAALKEKMLAANFDEVKIHNFLGGIVALHLGIKF